MENVASKHAWRSGDVQPSISSIFMSVTKMCIGVLAIISKAVARFLHSVGYRVLCAGAVPMR
jgi:hypothetical protein